MEKLSAVIICLNEEGNIGAAIESLAFADEVVVVDSGSTDRTMEIARSKSARVLEHTFENYGSQKNWGLDQCTYDWVLVLDADERINTELGKEIAAKLQNPGDHAAYSIPRRNFFMGQEVRYSGWQNDRVIRLVDRRRARHTETAVHEKVRCQGPVGQLRHKMDHYTYQDLNSYLRKSWDYAILGAIDRYPSHTKVTAYHLWLKPVWGFIKKYLFQLGFLDGRIGLIIAMQYSNYLFYRALNLWRLQEGEKIEQP